MTTASAPGKIILLGEHTALYGNPVLVAAIGLRARATVSTGNGVNVKAPGIDAPAKRLELGLAMSKKAVELIGGNYDITVGSDIPLASGMGSSASIASALVAALRAEKNLPFDRKAIAETAWKCEDVVHTKSSGVDPFAATYGGIMVYTRGSIIELKLKTIPDIVIAHTGVTSDTGEIVRYVETTRGSNSNSFDNFLKSSKALVLEGKEAVENFDMKRLGRLMNENHKLLSDLGISCEELDSLVKAARGAGAYGAKLCGAGKGGIMVALASQKTKADVSKALSKAGGKIVQTQISKEGVRLE
jgi:mevalonate kinase